MRLSYALRDRSSSRSPTPSGCLVGTVLLFRGYAASGMRLLMWSALCFVCLTLNNVLLFIDLPVFAELDLRPYRLGAALAGLLFLIYGFISESR